MRPESTVASTQGDNTPAEPPAVKFQRVRANEHFRPGQMFALQGFAARVKFVNQKTVTLEIVGKIK